MIYLDNAATTWPKPPAVRQAVQRALLEYGANPGRGGYSMSMRTAKAVYGCRAKAAEFFGAPGPECVIFQPSCTQALNLVMKGCLRSGDHAVVSDLEHNAVMRPLQKLAGQGVSYSVAKVSPADSVATMQAFREAMRPNTRLVVCTQASNVWGVRAPVERIAALCHQYGAKLCVDAAQSAGLVPIHMGESGVDYLCCAGHKGLYGPMGTGLLVLRNPEDLPDTLVEGGTGTASRELRQPLEPPERYESGTLNVPGIVGLSAGLDFVRRRGPEALWQEEIRLLQRLHGRLSQMKKIRLYTPLPERPWWLPVLSFTVEGMSSGQVGEQLGRAGIGVRCGLHCAPAAHEKMGTLDGGTVRVAPSAFTRREEIDALAARLEKL